jgi:hypothetical protein
MISAARIIRSVASGLMAAFATLGMLSSSPGTPSRTPVDPPLRASSP